MPINNARVLHFIKEAVSRSDRIIFAYDVTLGEFIYLNAVFYEIWNLKREDVLRQKVSLIETIHPDDRNYLSRCYQELLNGTQKNDIEFRIGKNGENQRWLSGGAVMIDDKSAGDDRVIVGIIEDITSWKEGELLLQKFAAKKDAVLEILSHDLAAPLKNIQGLSAILAEGLKEHKIPELDELVKMIQKTSARSVRLIREFVKHEFITSKKTSLLKERVDIVKLTSLIIEQYKESEQKISKVFKINFSHESIFLGLDYYKFSQVMNNLISNSIKFTRDDGEITVTLEKQPESILISVADNGIGIPEKYHEGLFDRFPNARRPGLKGEPSTGLGMSIIKTIVEWHDGKIWFWGKENEGSVFYIELPKG